MTSKTDDIEKLNFMTEKGVYMIITRTFAPCAAI